MGTNKKHLGTGKFENKNTLTVFVFLCLREVKMAVSFPQTSAIAGMPPPAAMIRDPDPMTMVSSFSSFPQAFSNMHDRMPTPGMDLFSLATDETGGEGHSEYHVDRNLILRNWSPRYSWMTDVIDGQLAFYLNVVAANKEEAALLNLFNLNKLLEQGYKEGRAILKKMPVADQLIVMSTPTWEWHSCPPLLELLSDADESKGYSSLRFLSPELFMDRFSFAGWIEGVQPDFSATRQRKLRTFGVIDSCENKWSEDIQQGENLWLILRPRYDRTKNKRGAYAYHPWAGFGTPPDQVVKYRDATRHLRTAQTIYVGQLTWYVENETLTPDSIAMTAGLTDASKDELPHEQSRSLRITSSCLPTGLRFSKY